MKKLLIVVALATLLLSSAPAQADRVSRCNRFDWRCKTVERPVLSGGTTTVIPSKDLRVTQIVVDHPKTWDNVEIQEYDTDDDGTVDGFYMIPRNAKGKRLMLVDVQQVLVVTD